MGPWCWVAPLPFGVQRALLINDSTAMLAVNNEAWLAGDAGLVPFDAGLPVTELVSFAPNEQWWQSSAGWVRFRSGVRTFHPGPTGNAFRGSTPGSLWVLDGMDVWAFSDSVGWISGQRPMDCFGVRNLAPLNQTQGVIACEATLPPAQELRVFGPTQRPAAFYELPSGVQANSVGVAATSDSSVVFLATGPASSGTSQVVYLDGGSLTVSSLPDGVGPFVGSDGTVFAHRNGAVYRLAGAVWSLVATSAAIQFGQPLDMVADTVLFTNGAAFGYSNQGSMRLFTTSPFGSTSTQCTALSRAGFVQFICNGQRYVAPEGPVVALPGVVSGTPMALDLAGDLWVASSTAVTRITPAGSTQQYSVPTSGMTQPKAAVTKNADVFLVASEGNNRVLFLKTSAASSFTRFPVATTMFGWRDIEPFGAHALAGLENRMIELQLDGGFTNVFDAGAATVSDICVASSDEYYVATLFPSSVYASSDGGLRNLFTSASNIACAPGRAIGFPAVITPIAGPTTTWNPPISPDIVVMRDDGATWVMTFSGPQVVFRPAW